jgi:hypothetical protein
MHRGAFGFELQTPPSGVALFWSIQGYALIAYLAYFGTIIAASWMNAAWLTPWMSLWTPLVGLLSNLIPSFDYSAGELLAAGFAKRIAIIHHLMASGWLFYIVGFIASLISIGKMDPADHDWMMQNLPNIRLLFVTSPMIFAVTAYWIVFLLGRVSEITPYPGHRYDVGLVMLGAPFIVGLVTGPLSVLAVKIALSSPERRPGAD